MKKLMTLAAFAAMLAFVAPASAESIQNEFYVEFDASGGFVAGGGTDYYGDGWYYYPDTEWWNIWFYDHPWQWDWTKRIHVEFEYMWTVPDTPGYLLFALNWSTEAWYLTGNPFPPIPPTDEEAYIVRKTLLEVDEPLAPTGVFHFSDAWEVDYNPEWVSIDVIGQNVQIINGIITHECYPPGIPTVSEWGLIIMALLVVTAGGVVIYRRRAAAA